MRVWRREARALAICVLVAVLINAGAIIAYRTRWVELVTQLGWVLVIAVVLYLVTRLVRGVVREGARRWRSKNDAR